MRPLKRLIPLEEALGLVLERSKPVSDSERIDILHADGRVASRDVVSGVSVPPFSRSAMDGYAVRAKDTYGASKMRPLKLALRERIYAGSVPRKSVAKGTCSEIATGAMLPKGADAVVMVEDTELAGRNILVYDAVHPGQNVSKKGEDISPGTTVVTRGEVLNPSKIGALAAIGQGQASVYRKPLVAVVPTGDEIAELGGNLGPGQVYNINSYTLGAVVKANGGEPRILSVVKDTVRDLSKAIQQNSDCDVIVFSGGSSVGERDIILDVLEETGEIVFHGIAVKPGKPTIFGMVNEQLVLGMPGYPTACLSNAYILLAPALRRIARLPERGTAVVGARMSRRIVSTTGRTQFLTVRLEAGKAVPAFKESGAITSMAFADGFIIIPHDVDLVEKDEIVQVHLL
jgi:molybdenum cofactor synthesis domain-containing protein